MKAEFDKEIDALLRRSLHAAGRGAHAPQAPPTPEHLDADELSAFAERALPEAAHRAAVSHLADCDQCRGAVVTLSRAAGEPLRRAALPVSVDPSEAVPTGGFFASLFSVRLLRLVVPALALCLVAAIGVVLLRTRREDGFVAQRAPATDAVRPGLTGPAGDDANAPANANADAASAAQTTADTDAGSQPAPRTSPSAPERPATTGAAAAPVAPDGSEGARDELSQQTPAPANAREDAPAPPPAAATPAETAPVASAPAPQPAARDAAKVKRDERQKAADDDESPRFLEREQRQQERRVQLENLEAQQSPDGGSRNRSANNSNYGGNRPAPAAPRREADRAGRSMNSPRDRSESREEAAVAGSERAVAGHRFRREGNAWVDVNYRPSMAMTGVRRGTEAFRALVADIPELGRIAEQLSGEVITVVRGRAYRIR